MSDLDNVKQQVQRWLEPLGGDDGPCGPDLEYENDFLELNKAAEGKPESQFDRGAPPDWRDVRTRAEDLFERTRDVRIALLWLRSVVNLEGAAAFDPALQLVIGLLDTHWDVVHPVPDPGDNDPYARANALAMLPRMDGALGDLLNARLHHMRGMGDVRLRDVEVALGSMSVREGDATYSREQLERMFVAADAEGAGLRTSVLACVEVLKRLGHLMNERFGAGSSAEYKPLGDLFSRALQLMPEPQAEAAHEAGEGDAAGDAGDGAPRPSRAGLSGAVNSRAEAVKAIELVCAYLERTEPSNPAQLFLKRASALLERNFLELLKELAPNSLDEVARMVGVDPNTVGESQE